MRRRFFFSFAAFGAIATGAVACTHSAEVLSTKATNAGADASSTPDPADYRTPQPTRRGAVVCGTARPPGMAFAGSAGNPNDRCHTAADCRSGISGRCLESMVGTYCSYDRCIQDSDCSAGKVCGCRELDPLSTAPDSSWVAIAAENYCYAARSTCVRNEDCGAGYTCAPSHLSPVFAGDASALFCHTPQDECQSSLDCNPGLAPVEIYSGFFSDVGTTAKYCGFNEGDLRWRCFSPGSGQE